MSGLYLTDHDDISAVLLAVEHLGYDLSEEDGLKVHEAEYLLRQFDTHALVMVESCLDSDYRSIMKELCPKIAATKAGEPLHCKRIPFLRNVITVGFWQQGCLTFDEAMARYDIVSAEQVARMAAAVRPFKCPCSTVLAWCFP